MNKKLLAISLLLGATISVMSLKPQAASAAVSNWQKAVMIQSRSSNDFASSSFNQSVSNAISDGANYITLVIPLYQSNIYSTDVQAGWNTPTDQTLTAAINYIHSKGAHVALSIHDDSYDGQWRAFINPSDRGSWFTNYGNQLNHYAGIARTTGVEEMVLGTEMTSMTSPSINGSNTGNWTTMIQSVRSNYSGLLTYSAQHDGYMSDLQSIQFWPKLDFIGISAYYGLGYDTSVSAIESQWSNVNSSYLQPLANRLNKQILFTEIGFASKSGSLADPGTAYNQGGGVDLNLQANAYKALFEYWNNVNFLSGVALWDWSSDPYAGGNGNSDYTPQNKPAEQAMKQGFALNGGMTGGQGGGTTTAQKYSISSTVSANPVVNSPVTITTTAAAAAGASNVLVDVEIYNAQSQQVVQKYYENQTLSGTGSQFTTNWTPTQPGTYIVKAGIFNANWQGNLTWNDNAASIVVASAQTPPATPVTPTPPVVTPVTPPVATPPVTPPVVTPIQTPTTANVSIWWPGSGTVYGVQPFKAVVDGRDVKTYVMYWQVDGDGLNLMNDIADPVSHKESQVDLSGWRWSSNNQYTINFVAKDLNGVVIAQKSQVITVGH